MKNQNLKKLNRVESIPNEDLSNQLSCFGLCPFDWIIESNKQNSIIIKNKDDEDFKFLGHLDPIKKTWKSIQLISL